MCGDGTVAEPSGSHGNVMLRGGAFPVPQHHSRYGDSTNNLAVVSMPGLFRVYRAGISSTS